MPAFTVYFSSHPVLTNQSVKGLQLVELAACQLPNQLHANNCLLIIISLVQLMHYFFMVLPYTTNNRRQTTEGLTRISDPFWHGIHNRDTKGLIGLM